MKIIFAVAATFTLFCNLASAAELPKKLIKNQPVPPSKANFGEIGEFNLVSVCGVNWMTEIPNNSGIYFNEKTGLYGVQEYHTKMKKFMLVNFTRQLPECREDGDKTVILIKEDESGSVNDNVKPIPESMDLGDLGSWRLMETCGPSGLYKGSSKKLYMTGSFSINSWSEMIFSGKSKPECKGGSLYLNAS